MKKTTFWMLSGLLFSFIANAQNVSGYSFAESAETYVPVSGTLSTAVGDDGIQNAIPFGFAFPFGANYYATFSISTNGFIRLGDNIAGQSWTNSLGAAAPQRPLIAVFWDDHNAGTGSVNYEISGDSPNRVMEIGWNNINPSGAGNASATAFGSFKMRLFETSGKIEFVYGATIAAVTNFSASIGLNDNSTFLSVTPGAVASVSSANANNAIASTANVVGKKYVFMQGNICSGEPNLGNVAGPPAVCANEPFEISLESASPQPGISYQWQSSSDGAAFQNIAESNYPNLQIAQTAATYYRCIVSCGNDSATTSAHLVDMTPLSDCYCVPIYVTGVTDGDLISNVTIPGTALSNNTGTAPVNPSYHYYSGQPNFTAELLAGGNYELQVTVGTYGQQNSTAWIDYNDDGIFSEDERIGYSQDEIGSLETATYPIQLSCDAPAGVHRLRIRNVYNTNPAQIDPCGSYGYGETEDYDITIIGGEDCPMPYALNVQDLNSSSGILTWNAACNQTAWNVYLVESGGAAPGSEPTYESVLNPFVFSGLSAETEYQIYVQGDCDANGFSEWAGPFTFATTAVAVANDDCHSAFALEVGGVFDDYPLVATNIGATKTLGEPNVTCATFGFGGDVWFKAVVPPSGTLSFETKSDPGSPLVDTGLAAYSGTCGGGLTALGCSDDNGTNGFSVLHLSNLVPGSTVYARVWEYANDTFGTFRVAAYDASLGVKDHQLSGLRYWPNPVNDRLNISNPEPISKVSIHNLLGQEIQVQAPNATRAEMDMPDLPTGNYFIKIWSGAATKTFKISKQ